MTMKWLFLALVLALGCSNTDKVNPSSTAERQQEIDRLNSLLESKDKAIADLKKIKSFIRKWMRTKTNASTY